MKDPPHSLAAGFSYFSREEGTGMPFSNERAQGTAGDSPMMTSTPLFSSLESGCSMYLDTRFSTSSRSFCRERYN